MATRGDAHLARTDHPGEPRAYRHDTAAPAAAGGPVGEMGSAGRYCLQDRVSEAGDSTVWKAFDQVLGRPVTARTFVPGFTRGSEVVAAARAACRVSDPRLERIFDADAIGGSAYIVTEWPAGDHLEDILAMGYAEIAWAARIIADAASALAAAHAAGIAHLHLTPRSLRWSQEVGVKITGLGIEAALAEPGPGRWIAGLAVGPEQAQADTRALARLLYAALTGHWPGPGRTSLPAAPRKDGFPYRPRQVRAGVPAWLDDITCRALFGSPPPVATPGELARLLNAALKRGLSEPARVVPDETMTIPGGEPQLAPAPVRPRRRRRQALAGGLVGALFVIDSALIGLSIMGASHPSHVAHRVSQAPRPVVVQSQRPVTALKPVAAQAFDPYGGMTDENDELAAEAIDGSQATAWHTFWYTTQYFGNLKPGTGLLLDMGRRVTVTSVRLTLGAVPGADVQLRIGDSATDLTGLRVAAHADDAGGLVTLRPAAACRGRYVLIWFTKLPPRGDDSGVYQADIYDVAVRGF